MQTYPRSFLISFGAYYGRRLVGCKLIGYGRTAIRILATCNIPFALRSGGHNPNPGVNSNRRVVIVTSGFTSLSYSPSTETVTLGAGLRWEKVFFGLQRHARTAVGPRHSQVGVSGYLLGGGIGHLSQEFGFGAGDVVEMEVTPRGSMSGAH